jgi:hypothetical protein
MIEFILHQAFFGPLVLDLCLGVIVGLWSKRVLWRVLAIPSIAFTVALVRSFRFGNIFTQSGESGGWAMLCLMQLAPAGLIACGLGILFGYLVRRVVRPA